MTGSKHRGLPEGSMGYARLKAGGGTRPGQTLTWKLQGRKKLVSAHLAGPQFPEFSSICPIPFVLPESCSLFLPLCPHPVDHSQCGQEGARGP